MEINEPKVRAPTTRLQKFITRLLLVLLLVVLLLILVLVIVYCIAPDVLYAYCIIVDAGSTSSKVTVFRWRDWPGRSNGWVEPVNHTKTKEGISAYMLKPEEASATLMPVIQQLLDANVPSTNRKSTRLFLGATAGMRLLNIRQPLYADELLEDLRYTLPKAGATVSNVYSDIRIISGDWEGRYAWISVNYLSKKLGNEAGRPPIPASETVGALDLGGASSQIAFAPAAGTVDANLSDYTTHVVSLRLFEETYRLYSYSFLCYGCKASQMRYFATLIEYAADPKSEFLSSPCHLNGYEFNLSTTEVFLHSCVDSQLATSTFKRSIKKPEGLPEYLKVIGTGRPEECRRLVSSLFDFTTCKYSSCSFNDVYQPPISGKFYAFAAFRYLTIFLEFQNPGINLTRSQTIRAVDDLCRTDWQKVVATFPEDSLKYIADNCYVGVLMDNLLHGYGFRDDESWKRIEFVEKIAEAPASWALGYALDATGRIPTGSPVSHIDPMAMAVGLTFLLCLLFVLLLILVGIKKHRLVL